MEASPHNIPEALVERRQSPRVRVSAPVQFRDVLRPEDPFRGSLSRDLSVKGACISAYNFVPKETRLVLLLSLPRFLKPIRVIGRVAWMRQRRFTEGYEVGVQFIEVLSQDQETITHYVEQTLITQLPPRPSSS